jgi:cyclophilin family peptidyl-prolyl cis-trans isomerase
MKRCGFIALVLCVLGLTSCGDGPQDKKKGGGGENTDLGKKVNVVMETSKGTIKIELYPDRAPITVKNFLQYVDDKHYDGTIFHRVIPDFMIQGGGMLPGLSEKKTREPIKNESTNNLLNERGTIAMARTNAPDSATSQFFINTVDNKGLDRANARDKVGYAVFGRVIEGMDIVDKIRAVETGTQKGHDDVPREDVIIKSIRRAD